MSLARIARLTWMDTSRTNLDRLVSAGTVVLVIADAPRDPYRTERNVVMLPDGAVGYVASMCLGDL